MEGSIKCYLLSWDEAYRLARTLALKIIDSGYKPDIIIGIGRGGLVPGRMICDFLLQNDLTSIRTEHWGVASKREKARIKFSLPKEADIYGKKILVVDDVADTGDSFSIIMNYLKEKNPLEIRTSVLQYKICSTVIPDYWGEKLEHWNWIIYPWAFYEDLAGFVQELLEKPATAEEIKNGLMKNLNINIQRVDLLEMLNDFRKLGIVKKSENDKKILWEKVNLDRINK